MMNRRQAAVSNDARAETHQKDLKRTPMFASVNCLSKQLNKRKKFKWNPAIRLIFPALLEWITVPQCPKIQM